MVLPKAQQITPIHYALANGLSVILYQDKSKPIISLSVLYHVGSKNDPSKRKGFAHFFEHLMFEGSENIKRGEFDYHIFSNGGSLNAYTTKDYTFYYESLPSNGLELALWLESERMLHAKVDKISIDTQREVVKEEKRQNYDNTPYKLGAYKKSYELLFNKHPYSYLGIGSMEDLDQANEVDYIDFYKTFYVPNNATLTLCGDFDIKQAKKFIELYFSSIPKGTSIISRPSIKADPIKQEISYTYEDVNAGVPALILSFMGAKIKQKEAYALNIIARLLGRGQKALLIKSLINEKELASSIDVYHWPMEDHGIFQIMALSNKKTSLDEIKEAIEEEIEKIKKGLTTQKQLDKQILFYEKQMLMHRSLNSINNKLANYHVFYKDINLINSILDEYKKITLEDIKKTAIKYLDKNKRVSLYNLPKK